MTGDYLGRPSSDGTAPAALELRCSLGGDWALVELSGELDLLSAPDLEAVLEALVRRGHVWLRIDMRHLEFIDARGLGALAATAESVAGSGSLRLVSPRPIVRRLLAITGLDGVVKVEEPALPGSPD